MSNHRTKVLGAVSYRSLEAVSWRSLASLLGSSAERSAAAATNYTGDKQ